MRHTVPTAHVAAARAEFLTSGSLPTGEVGDALLTSWRRSQGAGVDIDTPQVPYRDADDRDALLTHHAGPVIERLHEQLNDLRVSVVLTDAQGQLIERKDSEHTLARRFDTVHFAPGFNYAEAYVGTNGIGTALEEGRPVFVCGPEHFNEPSTRFACAGAPIRHPLTRRIEGLIDLSCLAEDASPMMRVLAQEAARDIERLILEQGSERQRVVLDEFLAVCRRTTGRAVVSVSGDVVITNRRASGLLTPADQDLLRHAATDADEHSRDHVMEMSLADGRWAHVRCHPVVLGPDAAGVVFEVGLAERTSASRRPGPLQQSQGLPGVVGTSPVWRDACDEIRAASEGADPLLVVGEAGVGKLRAVRAAHHARNPAGRLTVIDLARRGTEPLADLREAATARPATLVLQHLQEVVPSDATEVGTLLDALLGQSGGGCWVVATASGEAAVPAPLLERFAGSVTLPPLRHRGDDVDDLIAVLLAQLAPTRSVRCSPEVRRVLRHNAWPGNVTELGHALRAALRHRPVGELRREDLPTWCFTGSRRALGPLEALERDAIVRALVDAGGNRKQAAADLGMSRSSLYRKIHAFGIGDVGTDVGPGSTAG